ncbi:thermostable carboxypeptidase 1 [Paraphysoderma sedebokerense]|nr:thermostable carboxypeptidase 1 [Paraphysoderma sedebokerense]
MVSETVETQTRRAYDALCKQEQELNAFSQATSIAQWDQMVNLPPSPKAAASRGKCIATLSSYMHAQSTSKERGELIQTLRKADLSGLDAFERANVRLAIKSFDREVKIPGELVKEFAEHRSASYQAWIEARAAKDYSKFAPFLKKSIDYSHKTAKFIDPQKSTYDVLLDQFESEITRDRIEEVFSAIKKELIPMVKKIVSMNKKFADAAVTEQKFDIELQAKFSKFLAKEIGFDFDRGRLDVSVHPFTSGLSPSDVRITTRYTDSNLPEGIIGTIHETGHAMYEQGLPEEHSTLWAGKALSLGVHESQSLFWERLIGKTLPFWTYMWPSFLKHFPQVDPSTPPSVMYQAVSKCKPGLIRVEADELTYPLHVILRYELEIELLDGRITVDELPAKWNQKMQEYLGLTPENDVVGVMQDVHWPHAMLGYFPTYLLGQVMSAQWYNAMQKDSLDIPSLVEAGEFSKIKDWLSTNVHSKGSLYRSADELLENVTGEKLNPNYLIKYLKEKYSSLYGVEL